MAQSEYAIIPEYPMYEISRAGTIRNAATGYVVAQSLSTQGYRYAQLMKNGRNEIAYVHRLVAEIFVPNPEHLPIVNHIDECPLNVNADNLEWVSYKQNSNHGSRNRRIGEKKAIPIMLAEYETGIKHCFGSISAAADFAGISDAAIRKALASKKHLCGKRAGIGIYYVKRIEKGENDGVLDET